MLIDTKAAFHLGVTAELSVEDLTVAVLTAAVRRTADWGGDVDDLSEWLGCSAEEAEPVYAVLESMRPYLAAIGASYLSVRDFMSHLRSGGRAYHCAYVGPMEGADVPPQLSLGCSAEAALLDLYDGSGCSSLEAEHEGMGRWAVSGTSSLGEQFTERWDLERVRM